MKVETRVELLVLVVLVVVRTLLVLALLELRDKVMMEGTVLLVAQTLLRLVVAVALGPSVKMQLAGRVEMAEMV